MPEKGQRTILSGINRCCGLIKGMSSPEDRNYMDAEFVDLSFVQKRSDVSPSYHPNVLTGLRPQALREWLDRLFYQLESRQQRPLRLAGK